MKVILRVVCYTIGYFWVLSVSYGSEEVKRDNDAFYIWQRAWGSGKVVEAAKKTKSCRYYFLAGEFTALKTDRITPSVEFYSLSNVIIPVFRIHTSFFTEWIINRKSLTDTVICEFRRLCKKSGKNFSELQIDLDSPVSKLKFYGEFLQSIKKELPSDCSLSFTSLPCHLKSRNFKNIAKFADYYVLQVHGLEVPEILSDKVAILNIETAISAINDAEKLAIPYRLALPTYAYQLNFDRKTKKFLYLNAEKRPPKNNRIIKKVIAPDFDDLLYLIRRERRKGLKHCKGIVWFRMPVEGDRYNLDAATLQTLRSGKIAAKKIVAHWEKNSNGTLKLIIENRGILKEGEVNIRIQWKNKDGVYDLFRGFSVEKNDIFSALPYSIFGSIPPPGKPTPVGWFRADNQQNSPEIKLNITKGKRHPITQESKK